MKTILLSLIVLFTFINASCSNDEIMNDTLKLTANEAYSQTSLTTEEIEDLLFLREEEKLAHDVYLYSYDLYNLQIFKNISSSETQHMNSVLDLLNKYNIDDPAASEIGVFKNTELQFIYNSLIIQSSISLLEALKVGNKIEDLDINDIELNEKRTNKPDLLSVYALLKCGSKNHLRSFNKQVLQNNGNYIPEFISQDDFTAIVSTSNEQCNSNF